MSTRFVSLAHSVGKIIMNTQIIKVGYIFDERYRGEFQYDQKTGIKERDTLLGNIKSAIESHWDNPIISSEIITRGNNLTLVLALPDQKISLNFDTINYIVTQNKDRKINNKNFYPFDKTMDKYNSIYVSVVTDNLNEASYSIAEKALSKIIFNMNERNRLYEYKSMIIGAPIAI